MALERSEVAFGLEAFEDDPREPLDYGDTCVLSRPKSVAAGCVKQKLCIA
jgi:hypothetical protein